MSPFRKKFRAARDERGGAGQGRAGQAGGTRGEREREREWILKERTISDGDGANILLVSLLVMNKHI
jgi:hypothetical protein